MKYPLRSFAIILAAVFTFQILDIPPVRNAFNAKTCCGRTICSCSHAKGSDCPFRHEEAHKTSHVLQKRDGKEMFTKAPCASDEPLSLLPEYSKDFIVSTEPAHFVLTEQNIISASSINAVRFLWAQGIERPPRIFPVSL